MSKIIKLPYNGEVGYDATVQQIHEFYKIRQSVKDWLNTKNDEGLTNKQKILEAYDQKTLERLGYLELQGEEWVQTDKSVEDIDTFFPVPWPIVLHVESKQLQRDLLINQSSLLLVDNQAYNFGPREVGESNGEEDDSENFVFSAYIGRVTRTLSSQWGFLDSTAWDMYENMVSTAQTSAQNVSGQAYKSTQKLRVWVWCKALASLGIRELDSPVVSDEFNRNSIIDLTPFIMNMSVNQTEQAGSFSITLPPVIGTIPCSLENKPTGLWTIDESTYRKFMENEVENYVFKSPINYQMTEDVRKAWYDENRNYKAPSPSYGRRAQNIEYDSRVNLRDTFSQGDEFENFTPYTPTWWFREDFFFHNVISENDIIFIGGEDPYFPNKLKDAISKGDFFRSVDDLVNTHNMQIALVDTNSISTNAESTDVTIQIAGRDLMKLLIEDGSFFFQKSYANPKQEQTAFNNIDLPRRGDEVNAFNQAVGKGWSGVNRLVTAGLIESMYNVEARNIGFIMNLLISRLSNIEICQSKVFDSYGDLRTKFLIEVEEPVQAKDGKGAQNENEGE